MFIATMILAGGGLRYAIDISESTADVANISPFPVRVSTTLF
jgi:hypothetical protein